MKPVQASYKKLIERFTEWAETCSDIRAAVIVGSRARVDHPADEWADFDIILITTDPERYLSTSDWIENIGNPLLTFLEPTAAGGETERRVLFEGMLDVDFAIFPKRKVDQIGQLLQDRAPPQIATMIMNTFGRGMRVLIDRDGVIAQLQTLLPSIAPPPFRPPTQHEFLEAVNDFLYHAVFAAKHLRRGELWWTVTCLNCYMQHLLLQVMEWHAKATYGWNHETWFRGRFLEEWAHPKALKRLRSSFAHYDEEDAKHALLAEMDLFRSMAKEIAEKLSYTYPINEDKRVTRWIKKVTQ